MLSVRLSPEERRLVEEAAAKKGWKTANFLRVSALERAAQVLNLSRPSSFPFSSIAKRLAELLVAPREVQIFHEGHPIATFREWEKLTPPDVATRLCDVQAVGFRPFPLNTDSIEDEVEELQQAMRLGGAEFAAELIAECRRLQAESEPKDPDAAPKLPPPIDPHKLNA